MSTIALSRTGGAAPAAALALGAAAGAGAAVLGGWPALAAAAALAVAAVVALEPWIGVVLFAAMLPLAPTVAVAGAAATVRVSPADPLVALTLAAWAVRRLRGLPGRATRLAPAFLVLALVLVLSVAQALLWLDPPQAVIAGLYLARWLAYVALAFVVADLAGGRRRQLLGVILAAALIAAGVALYHRAVGITVVQYHEAAPGFGRPAAVNVYRVAGTFDAQPNHLAAYLAVIGAAAGGLLLERGGNRLWLSGLLAVAAVALVFTYSRSGWMGALAAAVLLGLLRDRRLVLALALLLAVSPVLLPRDVVTRITYTVGDLGGTTVLSESAVYRFDRWSRALQAFTEHPLLGVGFAAFPLVARVYDAPGAADSQALVTLVETGTIGALAFAWFLLAVLRAGRAAARGDDPLTRALGLGVLAGLCALLVAGLTINTMLVTRVVGTFWLLVGLAAAPPDDRRSAP